MIISNVIVSPYYTNCYIIGSKSSGNGIVIDPGDEVDKIVRTILKLNLNIVYIVATHIHGDHISAVNSLKNYTGAKFLIHEDAAIGFTPNNIHKLSYHSENICIPDIWLYEGYKIRLDDLSFEVIHTPGHTSGGICLYIDSVLFSGDTLFNYGIGRTDFPGGDYETLIYSIKHKLFTLPDSTRVLPGHGPETTIGNEKRNNPFLV